MTCKISIITITLNAENSLQETITSVIEQTYGNIEYIIIDGGSSDSSIDIIKRCASKIDHWLSEPDSGISQAMNKGVQLATGDYVLFLHSDDYLIEPTIIEKAVTYFTQLHDIYIFPVLLDDAGVKQLSHCKPLSWKTNFKMGSCHQGQFFSRNLLLQLGLFDESLSICMDYDIFLRAFRTGRVRGTTVTDFPVAVMRLGGISSRKEWPALRERFTEEWAIHKKNSPGIFMTVLYQLYWSLYFPYRRLLYCMQPLKGILL